MEREKPMLESFISNWNADFPEYELKVADLKEPQALMGALMQVFDRLGIDRAVLTESPEGVVNESMQYYRDLLPVINMTRVVNHMVSVMPQVASINMMHFLVPTAMTSHSILLLVFNLLMFNEDKLRDIAPYEEELFAESEKVNKLAERKHKLQEMLNEQAQEKALRAERLEKLEHDTKQLEEELKEEMEACNAEQQDLDEANKELHREEVLLDQTRTQRDAAGAELEKKKALRVYDAEDVKTQVEQATRSVAEWEEKGDLLQSTLAQKDDCLKNLQSTKPALDAANHLLQDIMRLAESLTDLECGDLETDSQEGELDVVMTELGELRAQDAELRAQLADVGGARAGARARRAADAAANHSALREATEKERQARERGEAAARRTQEIQALTLQFEQEKASGLAEISDLRSGLQQRLQSCQELLMNQMIDLVKKIEKQKKI